MSSIYDSIPQSVGPIESFGAGGQMYIADIWGGFNISAEQTNPLFAFSENDSNVVNAGVLTNLTEARKIGSTMEFKAMQLGIRIFKHGGAAVVTPAEVQAMKALLQSAKITITLGSNETKIAEFSGLHLMATIDAMAADATNTCASQNGAIGNTSWINLKIPVPVQANVNIGGTVKFNATVPSALTSMANSFGFVVILAGMKVVKS